jgi:hypothetical protein
MCIISSTETREVLIGITYETRELNSSQDCCSKTNKSALSTAHPKCARLATPMIANINKEIPTQYKQNSLFKLQNIIQTTACSHIRNYLRPGTEKECIIARHCRLSLCYMNQSLSNYSIQGVLEQSSRFL